MKIATLALTALTLLNAHQMPEIYQDVWVKGKCIQKGIRECEDRYEAMRFALEELPKGFKVLDIGASQGYFSFRMAEDYGARPVMIEDGYLNTTQVWETNNMLIDLCRQNNHIKNLTLLQKKINFHDLKLLNEMEKFDCVVALSVIHHMRKNNTDPFSTFDSVINIITQMAPIVLVENPVNTGDHTRYIRNKLIEAYGTLIHTFKRGTLVYELYLFTNRHDWNSQITPNIKKSTYEAFKGSYSNVSFAEEAAI